jgi:hypothetical protein
MYTNVQWYNDPHGNWKGIRVDINNMTWFVPLDPANTDYQNIMALVAAGELTIAPASSPEGGAP